MATAELTQVPARRLSSELRRVWLSAYGAIWAATLVAAALVAVVGPLKSPVRHLLALRLPATETPAPQLAQIVSLTTHNLPIAAWPLLLGVVGAHRSDLSRKIADTVLAGTIAVNVLPVGAALGAYGPVLLPYVPQLPLEWAALAVGASSWLLQRDRTLTITQALTVLAVTGALLLSAATVETLAVPQATTITLGARVHLNSRGGLAGACVDTQADPTIKELKDEKGGHGCPGAAQRAAAR